MRWLSAQMKATKLGPARCHSRNATVHASSSPVRAGTRRLRARRVPAAAAPLPVDVLGLVQRQTTAPALGGDERQGVVGGVGVRVATVIEGAPASRAARGRMHLLGIDRQALRATVPRRAQAWRSRAVGGVLCQALPRGLEIRQRLRQQRSRLLGGETRQVGVVQLAQIVVAEMHGRTAGAPSRRGLRAILPYCASFFLQPLDV